MITVKIRRPTGCITDFSIIGHSDYAEEGKDIICSAVSAVVYGAMGALDELAGIDGFTDVTGADEAEDRFEFVLPKDIDEVSRETARIILETMYIGLCQIEAVSEGNLKVILSEGG